MNSIQKNKMVISQGLYTHRFMMEDAMYLQSYVKLAIRDFNQICKWTNKDWNDYFDYSHLEIIPIRNDLYDIMMIIASESDTESDEE